MKSMSTEMHNRVALFRAERGMSRKELAEMVEVHPQTIGYIERGDYKPSLELGMKIAAVFDLPIEVLFSFRPFESLARVLKKSGESA